LDKSELKFEKIQKMK